AALRDRDRTGRGRLVDVAMLDCQVAILENALARYEVSGQVPGPIGNRHPSITPFTSVPAADGHLIIAVGNDALWEKLCRLVGRDELIQDPRFRTNRDRTEHWSELEPILGQVFPARTVAEWLALLEGAGIPCGPINTIDRVAQDPQVLAREMIVEVEHPAAGPLKMAGCPIKLGSPGRAPSPSPRLGEHTGEVLGRLLGLDEEELDRLRAAGAI
ncbi:MAG: CaiB/BaiF CoA transferase family protein, partial [Deferrisomatales bacterium]